MNNNQKTHFEYGQQMLKGKIESEDIYDLTGGNENKLFRRWLVENNLLIDPLTGKEASRPVRAACLWAAKDPKRFEDFAKRYPRALTVRSLYDRYRAEQNKGSTDPSVYVYRMLGPLSGEFLEPRICKIGYADNGAAARVAAQSRKAAVGYIAKIELELKCKNPLHLEKLLHKRFEDRQVDVPGKEWFEVSLDEIEKAIEELERDATLWRDGDWIHIGRKPKPPTSKPRIWSKDKSAAHLIYRKVLPDVEAISDSSSCLNTISEQTGLKDDEAKAGLQWLIKHEYLKTWGNGMLTPSEKFYEHWGKEKTKKEIIDFYF